MDVTLFGRDDVLDAVRRGKSPCLLLTGDRGVGKSAILVRAQATADAIAPAPITAPHSGGVIHRALLDSLVDAVGIVQRSESLRKQLSGRMEHAVTQLVAKLGEDLARLVGAVLLDAVRKRLGETATKALGTLVKHARTGPEQLLVERMVAEREPSVADGILEFTRAVAEVAGQPVVLAVDGGERLREADVAILADLAPRFPDGVRVRVAFDTDEPGCGDTVRWLIAQDDAIQRLPIPPLDVAVVASWLDAVGLDAALAPSVRKATSGYPLEIDGAIAGLLRGEPLGDLPLNRRRALQLDSAWSSLSKDAQVAARKLCVLADPLPPECLEQVLGVDTFEYASIVEELEDVKLFATVVNGESWFHEQRRLYVERRKLTARQRATAADAVTPILFEHIRDHSAFELAPDLARVVRHAAGVQDGDARVAAVLGLEPDELALLGGAMEFLDPEGRPQDVDPVASWARHRFGFDGDPQVAMDALAEAGLAEVLSTSADSLVVLTMSDLSLMVAGGTVSDVAGRFPVPRLATELLTVVLDARLQPFHDVMYGMGRLTVGKLARLAARGGAEASPGAEAGIRIVLGRGGGDASRPQAGDDLSAVLARGTLDAWPFYVVARYADSDARNRAAGRLSTLPEVELLGAPVAIKDVVEHPLERVPCHRFLLAADRLLNGRVTWRAPDAPDAAARSAEERIRRKLAAAAFIREHSSSTERWAYELEDSYAIHYFADGDTFGEAHVFGGGAGAIRHEAPFAHRHGDPYRNYRMGAALGLDATGIVRWLSSGTTGEALEHDVTLGNLEMFAALAERFNEAQPQQDLVLDEDVLRAALQAAGERSLADACALAASGIWPSRPSPSPLRTEMLLGSAFVGGRPMPTAHVIQAPSTAEQVEVIVVDPLSPRWAARAKFVQRFERIAASDPGACWRGPGVVALTRLLAYGDDDVRLLTRDVPEEALWF